MSTPDPERAIESDADELEERIDKLGGDIDDAKKKETELRAKDEGPLDGDAGSTAPEGSPVGDDASAFDDPEAEDEEDDEQ